MPGIGATGERTDDARGAPLPAWGEKREWGGTKMVRALLDEAGGQRFRGLQD